MNKCELRLEEKNQDACIIGEPSGIALIARVWLSKKDRKINGLLIWVKYYKLAYFSWCPQPHTYELA